MALERFKPTSLSEAIELYSTHREKAKIIGGGTDLVVLIKKKAVLPEVLISLEKVRELKVISFDRESGLKLGAMVTAEQIGKSDLVDATAPILCQAAGTLGNPLIRRTATIGGNLCNASPSADFAPACLVLGAKLKILGPSGEREMDAEDFFVDVRKTKLGPGEILTRLVIPPMPKGAKAVYVKATRSNGADLALVGVAVWALVEDGVVRDIRIGMGAVAPTPIRARNTEDAVRGKKWDDELIKGICDGAASGACCISDVRCTAEYRDKLIPVLLKRAIDQTVRAAG